MGTKSYICSSNTEKPHYATILDLFKQRVKEHPDKEALVHRRLNGERKSITFQALQNDAAKLARYLILNGVKKGDRIALSGLNTIEWVVAEFAIFMTGAILVNIGFTITDHLTIMDVLRKAQCKMFIFDMWGREKFENVISILFTEFEKYRASCNSEDISILLLRKSDRFCFQNLQDIMVMELPEVEFPVIYPEDPFAVFSTSGTVGKSKSFEHTHFSVVNMICNKNKGPNKFYNEKVFGTPGGAPEAFICRGQTRVFVDDSPMKDGNCTKEIWGIIKSENCTAASLHPHFMRDLISFEADYTDSFKLDAIMTGGQIIDKCFTRLLGKFSKSLRIGYGLTETGMITGICRSVEGADMETGNVGVVQFDKEIKIVDANGETTDRGVRGKIYVRSNFMFRGYIMSEDDGPGGYLTQDNWFKTGDVGYITKKGELFIVGRTKEVIVNGVNSFYPGQIEELVLEMDGIKSVVVISVPDRRMYQEICVCYIPHDNMGIELEHVEEFCKRKYLQNRITRYQGGMPKYYLPFDIFPELPSGKPNKRRITEKAIERLGIPLE